MQCFYMILLFILRPHTVFFRIMPVEQNLMSRSGSMDEVIGTLAAWQDGTLDD